MNTHFHVPVDTPILGVYMRECMDCKNAFPLDTFRLAGGTKARSKGQRISRCEPCHKASRQAAYEKAGRARVFLTQYGITLEQRDAMFEAQGKQCAACGSLEPGSKHGWVVDHDHACCPKKSKSCGNCIRGILCFQCNITLGCVKDSPETLDKLKGYLVANQATMMGPLN